MNTTVSSVVVIAVACIATISIGCSKKAPVQVSAPAACERPADLILNDTEVRLAAIQIGKASAGGIEFINNGKLAAVLSQVDRSALVLDYLLCRAEERGDLDRNDHRSVDDTRALFIFAFATQPRPTPEQVMKYKESLRPVNRDHNDPRPPYRAGANDIDPQSETCLPPIPANTPVCLEMHGDWLNGLGPLGHNRKDAVIVWSRAASNPANILTSQHNYQHKDWFNEAQDYVVCAKPPIGAQRAVDLGERMSIDAIERAQSECPIVTVVP